MEESEKIAYQKRIGELEGVMAELKSFNAELKEELKNEDAAWARQYEEKVFRGILVAKLVKQLGGSVRLEKDDLDSANLRIKLNEDGSVEIMGC